MPKGKAGLMPIALNWVPHWSYLLSLFQYTQHPAGFTENNLGPISPKADSAKSVRIGTKTEH